MTRLKMKMAMTIVAIVIGSANIKAGAADTQIGLIGITRVSSLAVITDRVVNIKAIDVVTVKQAKVIEVCRADINGIGCDIKVAAATPHVVGIVATGGIISDDFIYPIGAGVISAVIPAAAASIAITTVNMTIS